MLSAPILTNPLFNYAGVPLGMDIMALQVTQKMNAQ